MLMTLQKEYEKKEIKYTWFAFTFKNLNQSMTQTESAMIYIKNIQDIYQ